MSFELDTLSSLERPFFSATITSGGVVTEGPHHCLLGHRLDNATKGCKDGLFAEWRWDGAELRVCNDRHGIYPLFYSSQGNEIRVSPSIHHVLGGNTSRELNFAGLSVFLRLGFFIGEDTPFEHVHALPPNATLSWRDGQITLQSGGMDTRTDRYRVKTFDEAVDQYAHLFGQAISRRAPTDNQFTVPISGGRDSRHILFELLRQGHKPGMTLTVEARPPSANEDIRIARLMAKKFDLAHSEIGMPTSYFQANLKDIELTNFCGSGHTWLLPVSAWLKGRTDTLYDGLAGSVLSGGFQVSEKKLSLFRDGKLLELAKVLLRERGTEGFIDNSLRGDFKNKLPEDLAIERLASELAKHADADHPLASYIFWNRTRRGISLIPMSILSHIQNVYCPYLDHDVFDFLMNLDPGYSLNNALHDETIRRNYPEHTDIPFEDHDAPKITGAGYSTYYRQSAREFLAHLASNPARLTSRMLKSERVMMMLLRDLTRRHCEQSWYLQPSLYLLELERAARE